MKKKTLLVFALATISLVSWKSLDSFKIETKTYKLDDTASSLNWTGKYVSDGHTHTGTVKIKSGELTMSDNSNVNGTFIVDMKTIEVTDLQGDKKGYLAGHLNSADFFNTDKYSDVKVTITGMTDKEIMATINVLGKDINSTMPVTVSKTENGMIAKGKFEIDFSSLEMKGTKPSEGKPENQRTDAKIAFDLTLALK
jgi:polyisoprenoid-binding protein YceI